MKIGIMTMHRVQNMGSVLQAYALQKKLQLLGYDAELIDYIFPAINNEHFTVKNTIGLLLNVLMGFSKQRREKKIDLFRKKYLNCSTVSYSRDSIVLNPPQYDIYCTGSDQVWNPSHVKDDVSFLLNFAPDSKPKIAYASSFASDTIEEPFLSLYTQYLKKYRAITVREQSGVEIVKKMTGKEVPVVCDPTLLLTTDEWEEIANASKIDITGNYILVYLLGYMFNPRPGFYNIVESIRKATKLPVYYFNPFKRDMLQRHTRNLRGMGPADFVKLCKKASFIITDSFHGTAFATIYNVPLIGVVKDTKIGDGRIATLRGLVAGEESVVCHSCSTDFVVNDVDSYKCNSSKVDALRDYSVCELVKMLNKIENSGPTRC